MKTGRNSRCTCGSGKKYKACCMRADRRRPVIRGMFDPSLPVAAPKSRGPGNRQQTSGHWYVIRKGHGLPDTPELDRAGIDRAAEMIAAERERRTDGQGHRPMMAAASVLAAMGWKTPPGARG
jgi:hypothetical protein